MLKEEEFDYVIDLHRNLRTQRVKRALAKPVRAFDKINFAKWLHVHFKVGKLPNVHIVDRYLATVKDFVKENDQQGLDYFVTESDAQVLKRLPESFSRNGYVGLVIGAMHFTKQIPQHRIVWN